MVEIISKIKRQFIKGWSIGIYTGDSLFSLTEHTDNPVISSKDIKDIPVDFVADPFLVDHNGRYFLFFEALNTSTGRGEIALSVSNDCIDWSYDRVVLDEKFHLSYPCVFQWEGEHYMVPESQRAKAVKIYRSQNFPYDWVFMKDLVTGKPFDDPTIFWKDDRWWLFTSVGDRLLLYHSKDLLSDGWKEHPMNPIAKGRYARMAGRILKYEDHLIRFSQDSARGYGSRVIAFDMIELSTDDYKEIKIECNPFLEPSGKGWNSRRMHHVDTTKDRDGRWISIVDGYSDKFDPRLMIGLRRIIYKHKRTDRRKQY